MPRLRVVPREELSPWKLGGLTVRQLGARVWAEFFDDELLDRSAALSYYFIFSLFPTLLFLSALLGMLPGNLMQQLMGYVTGLLPGDAASLVGRTLGEVVRAGGQRGLLSVGVIGALWTASSGMASIMTALTIAYGVTDTRPWWKYRLTAIVLTLVFMAFTLTSLVLVVFGPPIGEAVAAHIGLGPVFTLAWNVVRWPVLVFLVVTGVALVYYLAPAVRQRWYWVTPGSVFAVFGWLLMSIGLRFYVAHFNTYNKTYGSIGGVILLLLWLYLTGLVLLVGAEINAEIEHAAGRRGEPTAKEPGEKEATREAG